VATIRKEIELNVPAERVWDKIADTSNISKLVGFVETSRQQGDARVCTLQGGGELTEKIVSVDHDLKRVMYSITESPLNMDFHSASMEVIGAEGGNATRLLWTVDLLPSEAVDAMAPMLDSACADMVGTLTE
jgi:hypothetical protein